ncbi:MAG TPA: hypothetical protein VEJ84_17205 [Acidimicrobiales bacterium]|nr:hypothetical protein [Acidimicrobiales bacterium]
MSSRLRTTTWVLFAVWAVFAVAFILKFHNFVRHPLGHASGGGGGIFLIVSQAALGIAVILIWRFGGREALNRPDR